MHFAQLENKFHIHFLSFWQQLRTTNGKKKKGEKKKIIVIIGSILSLFM